MIHACSTTAEARHEEARQAPLSEHIEMAYDLHEVRTQNIRIPREGRLKVYFTTTKTGGPQIRILSSLAFKSELRCLGRVMAQTESCWTLLEL